jgi:hypothetical protein
MADLAGGIRAALDRYARGALSPVYTAHLVRTLRAVVDRCVLLSQSDYPVRAGIAESLLRDIARELGVQVEYEVPVFEPQQLPGGKNGVGDE